MKSTAHSIVDKQTTGLSEKSEVREFQQRFIQKRFCINNLVTFAGSEEERTTLQAHAKKDHCS